MVVEGHRDLSLFGFAETPRLGRAQRAVYDHLCTHLGQHSTAAVAALYTAITNRLDVSEAVRVRWADRQLRGLRAKRLVRTVPDKADRRRMLHEAVLVKEG